MTEERSPVTPLVRVVHALFVTGAVIHLVLVCAQPVLAGWSLDGEGLALELHGINGSIIVTIAMILIPLSVLLWRPGRRTFWAVPLSVLLFAAETFQLGVGYANILVIHVPLGVGISLGSVVLVALALIRPRTHVRSTATGQAATGDTATADATTGADQARGPVTHSAGADVAIPATLHQRAAHR